MNRNQFLPLKFLSLLFLLCASIQVSAQTTEVQKIEVGLQFTTITKPDFNGASTEPGVGARFTFNFNRSVAFEAVGNYFPHSCNFCGGNLGDNSGIITQGFFGVKAGKRFEKWGIFAKVRPGVVRFGQGHTIYTINGTGPSATVAAQRKGQSNFATDLGAVLEFYPSKHLVTRFDFGDTLIHYGSRQRSFLFFDPLTSAPTLIPFTTRSETRHNFQFSAGVGWRF
ncbi:MAG TPA: outer membrane beta-barrel protein [Pyrinomonadaceae bacterium]|jgi:hypothetical protein|nr:outer membrane beta-barrel protein [Pyrinomonadaceae bacterium]